MSQETECKVNATPLREVSVWVCSSSNCHICISAKTNDSGAGTHVKTEMSSQQIVLKNHKPEAVQWEAGSGQTSTNLPKTGCLAAWWSNQTRSQIKTKTRNSPKVQREDHTRETLGNKLPGNTRKIICEFPENTRHDNPAAQKVQDGTINTQKTDYKLQIKEEINSTLWYTFYNCVPFPLCRALLQCRGYIRTGGGPLPVRGLLQGREDRPGLPLK